MRNSLVIALSLAVLAVGSAAAGGDREASTKAKLKLTRGTPLTLRGTQFAPGERVRVVAVARTRITKRLNAGEGGAFVVRFPELWVDRCEGFSVFAVGARGSRASLKSPEVYCPPRL